MEFEEKVTDIKHLYEGNFVKLDLETVVLPNNEKATREIIRHPGAVGIVAITPEEKIVLIRQWRAPLRKITLEIPAGKIEKGEHPDQTAVRELNEETRFTADTLERVNEFYTSPGFADEKMYLYHASGLHVAKTKLPQDEDEFLQLEELTIKEVQEQIANGTICDSKTLIAIMLWQMMK
ncbi:NUDIX hydrolase [Ligilactobacillus sp. WILCCON 0076]|uniref:NUDIX hydrolase n=1 Tax=Ligilactobacillus ubinensis TaxID=2876789 RepID=A0A9X2JLV9_9LACO|nr:NUDIX hydrolase [Ligilactobacillus ubinensis]MCP0886486.1 NUDIX hydrolase [Ligilactobacillus ubinensis]